MKGSLAVAAFMGTVLLAFVVWGLTRDPLTMVLSRALAEPSSVLPFGADHLGRDVLSRVAHGFYWDISLSFAVVLISAAVGVAFGLAAGYFGGLFDQAVILAMDSILSMPHIVLAMIIMLYLSYGPESLVIALALPGWVKYARIVRAQTYSLKQADFVICEQVLGAGPLFIIFRHLAPNIIAPLVGLMALHLGHTLMSIAALGFLGLGLQPPSPEWGTMIMESRPYIMRAPWTAFFPGLFVFLFIFVFTLLGRKIEAACNPLKENLHVVD